MNFPPSSKILLHRGKDLAAEVPCSRSGWRAWVWVDPVMKSGKNLAQVQEEWTRTRVSFPYDDTIVSFKVRYVELSDWHLSDEWYFDLDIAIEQRPIVDKNFEADNEEALIELLSAWLPDLSRLTGPNEADYPEPPPAKSAEVQGVENQDSENSRP